MPEPVESYPTRWKSPEALAREELVAAVVSACERLRADSHFATALRLEAAVARVTTPLAGGANPG